MAFDIVLRDNGVGTFDITLGSNTITTGNERVITFLGLITSETSSATGEISCVFHV